jgi:hypothetical protein
VTCSSSFLGTATTNGSGTSHFVYFPFSSNHFKILLEFIKDEIFLICYFTENQEISKNISNLQD